MTLAALDFYFPFIVFCYGFLVVLADELTQVLINAGQSIPDWTGALKTHLHLAWICFFVGGFWSLQNLIFT